MMWLVTSKLGRLVGAFVGALLACAGIYLVGQRSARQAAENEALKRNVETRERIDNAVRDTRRDASDVRERLRNLAE